MAEQSGEPMQQGLEKRWGKGRHDLWPWIILATTLQCSISVWEENWDGHKVHSLFSSVTSGYLLSTHSCGVRILSAVRSGLFCCSPYCQPFPEHCILDLWYGVSEALLSSCMLLNKLGLFDRVTQASLVQVLTSYNCSVNLSLADSPLAAHNEIISHRLCRYLKNEIWNTFW